jgi:hypothetical protein
MNTPLTLEQVEALAAQLPPEEQRRLAEKILQGLTTEPAVVRPRAGRSWSEIRGIVPYPMCGEDAQQWVSRTRREADEQRERQWRPKP